MTVDKYTVDFLVSAARLVPQTGWIFTGFNWPILAVRTARRLGHSPVELFESGQAVATMTKQIPSSTTDFHELTASAVWAGTTADTFALVSRARCAMLDAADTDLAGRVNTFGSGPVDQPTFRSAGGGGSADAAARASTLILLHGGSDVTRLSTPVEHVTATPGPTTSVLLVTRWGVAHLGAERRIVEISNHPDAAAFIEIVASGAELPTEPSKRTITTPAEHEAAVTVLHEAARRGYRSAAKALGQPPRSLGETHD